MFMLAVTRRRIARVLSAPFVRDFQLGDWTVSVATDEWLARCDDRRDGVRVYEVPPFAAPAVHGRARLHECDADVSLTSARFDGPEQFIEIARALLGGRQVYYCCSPAEDFFCGTHIRLFQEAGFRLEENRRVLAELLTYRYVTAPGTLFEGVGQLLAGERLGFRFEGEMWRPVDTVRYRPPEGQDVRHEGSPVRSTRSDFEHGVRSALHETLRTLEAGSPQVHVLASGGLDSSILFRLAQTTLGISNSYSTGYPFEEDATNVEKRYALSAAEAFGAHHRYVVPTTNDFLRGVLDAIAVAEQPLIFTQSVLLFLLFRDGLPPGRGTVVIGQGADGLFGLRLHRIIDNIARARAQSPSRARLLHPRLWKSIRLLELLPHASRLLREAAVALTGDRDALAILTAGARWGPGVPLDDPSHVLWRLGVSGRERWARRQQRATRGDVIANRRAAMRGAEGRHVLDLVSLLDFLADVSATQSIWSKLAESAQKLAYYPFNAPAVLDSAFRTPWELKLEEPKAILRDVARAIGIPEFIVSRRKADFTITSRQWELRRRVFAPLISVAGQVWEPSELRRMQAPGGRNFEMFWTVVNYAIWRRLFISGERLSDLHAELEAALPPPGVPASESPA